MDKPIENQSLPSLIGRLTKTSKNLLQSEAQLAKAELKESSQSLARHASQAAAFGAFAAIGVMPFLAFLVVGLGKLMSDMYWLSALIVAVICMGIGGGLAFRAYRKIKKDDLSLPVTRESLHWRKSA